MELVEGILGAPYDPLLASSPLDAGPDLEARRDRVRGMLYGAALGDALGAPHEFRNQVPLARYTGSLEHSVTLVRRFQGGRLIGNVAQCTDDTEMTIALADSIIAGAGAYRAEAAAKQYIAWANSSTPFLGNNTRALFHGIKTYRGYENRWEGAHSVPEESWSQSNGCLMRCSPLAVLQSADWRAGAELDCRLTNPHPVCIDSVRSYICAMRAACGGYPGAGDGSGSRCGDAGRRLGRDHRGPRQEAAGPGRQQKRVGAERPVRRVLRGQLAANWLPG